MKHVFSILLCVVLLLSFAVPAFASEMANPGMVLLSHTEALLENGLTMVEEKYETSQSRSSTKTGYVTRNFYDGSTLIATITLQATFRYDGSSVSVVSRSVTQSDTYDGWSYVQNSLTASGGTVTLSAKLTKWIILNTSFTMTLDCDEDGNIS